MVHTRGFWQEARVSSLTTWASLHEDRLPQRKWFRERWEGEVDILLLTPGYLAKVFQVLRLVIISQMRNVCTTRIRFISWASVSVPLCLQNSFILMPNHRIEIQMSFEDIFSGI